MIKYMEILLVSQDKHILNIPNEKIFEDLGNFKIYDKIKDPLEIISTVHTYSPAILVLDDDMIKPNSSRILRSIKQITQDKVVIFLTSDNSIELGREISPMGIYYYGIKPITKETILDIIKSVKLKNRSKTFSN